VKVAILGSGINALIAAWAAERSGHEPELMANTATHSVIPADMFLLEKIPDINAPSFQLEVYLKGNKKGYAERVYGDPSAPCALDTFLPGRYVVWGMRETYEQLWRMYGSEIKEHALEHSDLEAIARSYDLALSTIPANVLCRGDHSFYGVDTYHLKIPGDDRGFFQSSMVYNGELEADTAGANWYRFSSIRGIDTWEYTHVVPGRTTTGIKPIETNCDCYESIATSRSARPGQLHRIGRFAKWTRGVLAHHAFQDTVAHMANEGMLKSI